MREENTEPRTYYNPKTLGRRWDTAPDTIRRMAREGRLRYVKLGRLIRIPIEEVLRFEAEA